MMDMVILNNAEQVLILNVLGQYLAVSRAQNHVILCRRSRSRYPIRQVAVQVVWGSLNLQSSKSRTSDFRKSDQIALLIYNQMPLQVFLKKNGQKWSKVVPQKTIRVETVAVPVGSKGDPVQPGGLKFSNIYLFLTRIAGVATSATFPSTSSLMPKKVSIQNKGRQGVPPDALKKFTDSPCNF